MIRRLMGLGVMVEPEAAQLLGKGDADKITEKIKKMRPMPLTVDAELAKKLVTDTSVKVLKKIQKMKSASVPDLVAAYNERYTTLQKIILKNPAFGRAVSIRSASGECCIIGMASGGGKTIQDPSGEGEFITAAKLLDGDVIGAIGTAEGGVFRASEIVFPGVQLKERGNTFGTFTVGRSADCPIRPDATTFYDVNGRTVVTSDAELDKAAKQLNTTEKEAAVELLKRRRLMAAPRDYLEPQPDFLIFNATENFAENHKGAVIIGIKEGSKAEANLESGTVTFKQV